MAGNRERLRRGYTVEVEPGVRGRLNKQNRTLELSSGKALPISEEDQRALFPESEAAHKLEREKEYIESDIKKMPGGEFFHQLGQKGIIGASKKWIEKAILPEEEYKLNKQAESEVGQRISKESPWTSGAATAASFIPDLALTGGMSAFKAAPLLTAASAGPRIIEEPGQVAGEAALGALAGKFIDIGGKYLSKGATRRGTTREFPKELERAKAKNIAGKGQVASENAAQQHQYNLGLAETQNKNAELLKQHTQALADRENKIIQSKNAFQSAKSSQTATKEEIKRLGEEYELAKKQHAQAMAELPQLQKNAQADYSYDVQQNISNIERSFPKNAKINVKSKDFLDQYVNTTGLAGSSEGAQATRILKSLFPEGQALSTKELGKRYHSIEEAIQRSNPEVQKILSDFKNYLGERLPTIVEDNLMYNRIMPAFKQGLSKDVKDVLKTLPLGKQAEATRSALISKAENNISQLIKEISPDDFSKLVKSGQLSKTIRDKLLKAEDFVLHGENLNRLKKEGLYPYLEKQWKGQHEAFLAAIENKINNRIAANEIKALNSIKNAHQKLGEGLKKSYGIAEPVPPPSAPTAPVYPEVPPLPNAPETPPIPSKPGLLPKPIEPSSQPFIAQPEPTLAPPVGTAERMADRFEKGGGEGKGRFHNKFTRLANIQYLASKAALPIKAAMKGLTSPTAGGEIARQTFKQGGIASIESWASRYPSYHNGVLENPMERRSLNKEIEQDYEIPIEEKAIIQSKINRGIPLSQKL